MSPKMLIYAGVNLHQWAQPRAKRTPAEWSLSWADNRGARWSWWVEGGYLPPLLTLPLPALSRSDHSGLIADCWDNQSELQAWWKAYSGELVSDLPAKKNAHTFALRWGFCFCWAERIKHEIFVLVRHMNPLKNSLGHCTAKGWALIIYTTDQRDLDFSESLCRSVSLQHYILGRKAKPILYCKAHTEGLKWPLEVLGGQSSMIIGLTE